jgi:hypothetical protein
MCKDAVRRNWTLGANDSADSDSAFLPRFPRSFRIPGIPGLREKSLGGERKMRTRTTRSFFDDAKIFEPDPVRRALGGTEGKEAESPLFLRLHDCAVKKAEILIIF